MKRSTRKKDNTSLSLTVKFLLMYVQLEDEITQVNNTEAAGKICNFGVSVSSCTSPHSAQFRIEYLVCHFSVVTRNTFLSHSGLNFNISTCDETNTFTPSKFLVTLITEERFYVRIQKKSKLYYHKKELVSVHLGYR